MNEVLNLIKRDDIESLATDLAEVTLDSFLKEGVLREVPFVGTVMRLYKVGSSVGDQLFLRRLGRFLQGLSDLTAEERQAFLNRLESDTKKRALINDSLLSWLSRLDDQDKAEYLSRAFKAHVLEDIDLVTLQRFALAIDRCIVPDLKVVGLMREKDLNMSPGATALAAVGFVEPFSGGNVSLVGGTTPFRISPLGKEFASTVLDGYPDIGPSVEFVEQNELMDPC